MTVTIKYSTGSWAARNQITTSKSDGIVSEIASERRISPIRRLGEFAAVALAAIGSLSTGFAQGLEGLDRIGFFGSEFTATDGFQSSTVLRINGANQVIGTSDRFVGMTFLDSVPWVYDSQTGTVAVGLAGAEFTRTNGAQDQVTDEMMQSGWIRGTSSRYLGTNSDFGQAAWMTQASTGGGTRVGLFDAQHTGGQYQFTEPTFLTEGGIGGGYSLRFGANATELLGQSAWLAGPVAGVATTSQVGLSGGLHTRNDGFRYSVINRAVDSGASGGYSRRYSGMSETGETAWVARWDSGSSSTAVVGFYDAEHTRASDGYQYSRVDLLNDDGRAAGYSERFSVGGASVGQSAWLTSENGAQTSRIGIYDSDHTAGDGYQFSQVVNITDSGVTAGYSLSYPAGAPGSTAWLASGATPTTTKVGFYSGEFRSTSGLQISFVRELNEAGTAIGGSRRFLGELENGNAAWKASTNGTTTRIGLTDAEHTSSGNKQDSVAEIMNSAGQSIGISTRYQGASSAGQSAWFASSSGVTSKIGLAGTEFTSSTGYHYSSPEGLNVGGLVVGYTERYNGGTTLLGEATWASTQGGLTRRLGFNDALHTASNGTQFSAVTGLTDSGFIAGYSDRFSGSTALGITAWIYQPSLENPEALIFSTSLSGKAYTDIDLLLESGVAAGSFTLYDGETDLGRRAFAYLPGVGGFDLGTYIGGSQFSQLTQVLAANPDGFLTGLGTPLGTSGQAVFVAQAIPEPSALTLLAGAILLIVGSLTIRGRKFRRSALGLAFVAAAALFFSTPVQAGEPLSFSSWLDKYSLPQDQRDPLSDFDRDGYANVLEYVFGTDPVSPDLRGFTAPHLDSSDAANPVFVYQLNSQSAGSVTTQVMESTDLTNWSPAAGEAQIRSTSGNNTFFAHPATIGENKFYTLQVRIQAGALTSPSGRSDPPADLTINVGSNVGSAWDPGLPPLPNVTILGQAPAVDKDNPEPDTSKYPSAAGGNRSAFTQDLLDEYKNVRNQRPPRRSWMGWFLWGDGTPPPGIKPGIHTPGEYGTYDNSGWDYFNYQYPKTNAPDGGRSGGSWNPIRLDQQPLFLNSYVLNYNWAPGLFGYESKPLKNFPNDTSYFQDKSIVRGVNLSAVVPFFYQYGNKLTASSVPSEWHQAWIYLAMRPLETTVIVPGNLKPDEVFQADPSAAWNKRPDGTVDPFPYPVWDKSASASSQTPFSIKVDRIGDFDADLVYEAANPRDTAYYAANRYRRTPFSQNPGIGNYMKLTVSQGSPFVWAETNNNRYVSFYNLIRTNRNAAEIKSNTGTGAKVLGVGTPKELPGTGVSYVLLYGNHVNPNQWYQEVSPWYFDAKTTQTGGFNPPPGSYQTKQGSTVTAPGQDNHVYTAIFYRTNAVKKVSLSSQPSAPGFNNGTDAQGNPYFYLEFADPKKNWFVVANIPPMRYYHTGVPRTDSASARDQAARDWAETMGQYAFNFLTDTKITYSADNVSESVSIFSTKLLNPYVAAGASGASQMTVNPNQTVLTLNPHQYQPITLGPDLTKAAKTEVVWNPLSLNASSRVFPIPSSAPANANRSTPTTPSRWNYWGLRGNLKTIIADSFTVRYPFQNFLPVMPPPDYNRNVEQTGIAGVFISNTGTKPYTNYGSATLPVTIETANGTAGFGATAEALVDLTRGTIQQINVVSPGQGYPDGLPAEGVTVKIPPPGSAPGTGEQATAYVQTGGGKVLAVFMLNTGKGYSPTISVTQPGQSIDAPIIVPRFDGKGNLLPGLAEVIEQGAGFDFSKPVPPPTLIGNGEGAVIQIIRPGNILQIDPPPGGAGAQGNYASLDGNPPAMTVSIPPAVAGGPAQTAQAIMQRDNTSVVSVVTSQGEYGAFPLLKGSFTDDSPTPQEVPLVLTGGPKLLSVAVDKNWLNPVPSDPKQNRTFVLNGPKSVAFTGGSPLPGQDAQARVYPAYFVTGATLTGTLVNDYTGDVQVSFIADPAVSDPAVPGVTAPKINFTIPSDGLIKQSDLVIADPGSGMTYSPIDVMIVGGLGWDASFQPAFDGNGGIKAVHVLTQGSNYLPNLKMWVNQAGHTGTPAELDVVVTNGRITAVNVVKPGSGYGSSLALMPIAGTYPTQPAPPPDPDPVVTDNPKGYPAKFTAMLVDGKITAFNQVLPLPALGLTMARYIPGSEGKATVDSAPAIIWNSSLTPFPRVTAPAQFFQARVAPKTTNTKQVLYSSLISQYTTLTGKNTAPFNGAFLGLSAPDGYGLGNQLGAAGNFLGDVFNLQQQAVKENKQFFDIGVSTYAQNSARTPRASYEFDVFANNNPFGSLNDSLRGSVQGMQRAIAMLFQNPPSTNAPKGESVLGTTWQEYYYAQYDNAVGRIVINPTATQPAWGVVSSVQLPSTIGSENDSKTGLSKWEKGMLWSGFGVSDQWNDQHYFYGYYLSSAALAGIFDRAWEPSINGKPSNLWASPEQMGTAVDQLLMTLANDPDNAALSASLYKVPGYSYQKFAFFDQYGGHPWATGIPPGSTTAPLDPTDPLGYWGAYGTLSNKYNGENENSAFEGAQAWAATILWGAATDRKSVVDLGIYLFSTNLAAVDSYFFDKNYNFVTENHDKSLPPLNRFSWTPVTTIDSANVTKNGDNDGWPANTGYVDANPKAMYVSPAAFGGEVSAGQSLMKKAESTLNNYFYTFPTGSRFIQAYPPTAWTLGMARNSTYSRKWAGTMMQKSWKDARESALYQPAEWLSMSMTTAAMGVPYSPGDEPFPTDAPPLAPYSQRLWSSWVTANSAPGDRATRNPSVLSGTVLTFLTAFETHGTPDWTYVARASDAAGVDDNTSIVFSATFTKPGATGTVDTSFVAFNPGWITRHVAFYRLDANGNRGTTPMDDPSSTTQPKAKMIFAIPPKTLLVEKRSIAIE